MKLDSENRRILECKADTDVRLAARMQGGAGPESVTAQARELAYDPQKDSLVLSGGAALQQGQRTIRGERIEIHPTDAEIAVTGAGSLEGQAEKDSEGFSISWEREMRFSRATQSAVFKGGVGLKYGGDTLRAESLTAQLSENALKGFEATGGVDLDQAGGAEKSGRTLKADSLSAEIGADRKLKRLDASGHVTIREEVKAEHLTRTRTLTADRVVSAMDEKTKLQGYEATGHVALREDAGSAGVSHDAGGPDGRESGRGEPAGDVRGGGAAGDRRARRARRARRPADVGRAARLGHAVRVAGRTAAGAEPALRRPGGIRPETRRDHRHQQPPRRSHRGRRGARDNEPGCRSFICFPNPNPPRRTSFQYPNERQRPNSGDSLEIAY